MLYRGSLLGAHKAILGLNFRVFLFGGIMISSPVFQTLILRNFSGTIRKFFMKVKSYIFKFLINNCALEYCMFIFWGILGDKRTNKQNYMCCEKTNFNLDLPLVFTRKMLLYRP